MGRQVAAVDDIRVSLLILNCRLPIPGERESSDERNRAGSDSHCGQSFLQVTDVHCNPPILRLLFFAALFQHLVLAE